MKTRKPSPVSYTHLDELLEAGALTEEEHAAAVERAEFAFGDPALDQPMNASPAVKNERMLH